MLSTHPLLITGHPFEWLAIPGLGRVACTFLRHQPPLIAVSADALMYLDVSAGETPLEVWETVRIFGAAALSRYIGESAQHSQLVVIDSQTDDEDCTLRFAVLGRHGWRRGVAASVERTINQAALQPDTIACDALPVPVPATFTVMHRYARHG
ncbi:hypothetical protein [Dickeya zeae]|uniref:Uncharacterized protein n=1 Tax=Dickeya zeae TaxID=204042 RepID=A0AAE6Z1E8_9GAMM|nr:hypothetical protein [Dickeya zeae]MCO7262661.1 hypothetical protein [Dickeya zeae]QIZ51868.1 hypothetical protein DWG24_14510 [Dickeya zeae]QYM94321.1 hypothetical protein FGI21_07500 [Dickeya zeae]